MRGLDHRRWSGQGLVQHGALAVLPDKRLLGI